MRKTAGAAILDDATPLFESTRPLGLPDTNHEALPPIVGVWIFQMKVFRTFPEGLELVGVFVVS